MGVFSRNLPLAQPKFPAAQPKVLFTTLPPPDPTEEEDRGLVVIQGSGAQVITLSHSHSSSATRSVMRETTRTVDDVRIKNPDNPDQHVDVQRPVSVNFQRDGGLSVNAGGVSINIPGDSNVTQRYARQPEMGNVEVLERDVKVKNPDYRP